ncbi:MAG: DHA3 family macrolide efflux protein-like MFS transporter [Maribacter sp.]|jgi:DHA3 family macrolide efflux protein-like MFS transporter
MQGNLDAHQETGKRWENKNATLLLFLANFISGIAQGISMIAIPWYFTQQGDMVLFGYLYAGITAVSLIWGPFSGTLVDKYDRRKIFLVLNIVLGIILLSVSFYGFQNDGVPWLMVGFVYLMTFMNYNLHYPNLYAFAQEITEKRFYGKITSYLEIQGQLASVLAGAGAALLLEGTENGILSLFGFDIPLGGDIEAWDIHHIFLVDGLTYFVGFSIIYMIKYRALVPRRIETGNVWQRMKVGYYFLIENKSIFIFGVASYSIFMCVLVVIFYSNPIYVEKHLQEGGDIFASSEICYALGAIFSGAAIRYIFNEKYVSITLSIIIMTFVTAILFLVLNLSNNIPLFFLMIFILGITNAGTRIQRVTYLFRRIPNQYYGRAGSIFFITNIIFRITFVSIFALPFFQTGNNIIYSMGILSTFLLLSVGLLVFFYKRIR